MTAAIQEQAATLIHTSNIYNIEWQQKLADLICELSAMDRVFFGNSGAEANEAAIKLARLYGNKQNIHDPQIVVMEHSFHGRTMATLSATGNRKVHVAALVRELVADLIDRGRKLGIRPAARWVNRPAKRRCGG